MPEVSGIKPLLTIAIPTFNRRAKLAELLEVLLPQVQASQGVEVFVSDNGSSDDTEAMVRELIAGGAPIRYEKQPVNLGSDRNFVHCFESARGTYFWLCGDDDIICPGSLEKVLRPMDGPQPADLIYVSSYGFRENYARERQEDPLGRRFQSFTSVLQFARVVNIMFTYISAVIVNRDRLHDVAPLSMDAAVDDANLVQLHWSLPLLLDFRRGVVVWDRCLAAYVGGAGGYALGDVFGRGLKSALGRLLPGRNDLQRTILGPMLRRWLPQAIYDTRQSRNERLGLGTAAADFRGAYGGNARYWLFAYPVLRLPLPVAKLWLRAGQAFSKLLYVVSVPRFWRKEN